MYSRKDRMRVFILTDSYRIEGEIYLVSGSRLTDIVNVKTKDFFPITDAKISSNSGEVLYSLNYVAVNRDAITAIFPAEDLRS